MRGSCRWDSFRASWNLNILDVFWTKQVQIGQNVAGRWQVGGGWQVQLGPYLMLGICRLSVLESCLKHSLLWKERERSRVRAVQMDRGLLGIRMDRVPNARIRELCGMKKGLNERIDEGGLRWFGYVERTDRDRIAKSLCRGVCR